MEPIMMANLIRGTLSLDDADGIAVPLVWVTSWQSRLLERFMIEAEFFSLVEAMA